MDINNLYFDSEQLDFNSPTIHQPTIAQQDSNVLEIAQTHNQNITPTEDENNTIRSYDDKMDDMRRTLKKNIRIILP